MAVVAVALTTTAVTLLLAEPTSNVRLLLDLNRVPVQGTAWDAVNDVAAQQLIYLQGLLWAGSVIWLLRLGRRWQVLGIVVVPAVAELFSLIAAQLRPEQRPFTTVAGVHRLISHSPGQSFPSDHATAAFALAAACLVFTSWRIGAVMTVVAVAVSVARVAAGVHYPADVVAGACSGFLSAVLVGAVLARRLPDSATEKSSAAFGSLL